MDSWRAVILAAGSGTRMRSKVPKVLQPICGREMVGLVADALCDAGFHDLMAIVPPNSPGVRNAIGHYSTAVEQAEPLGTAHALSQARQILVDYQGDILVINGDAPLITPRTLAALTRHHSSTQAHVTLLTCTGSPTRGLGWVVRDDNRRVVAIVEEADRVINGEQDRSVAIENSVKAMVVEASRIVQGEKGDATSTVEVAKRVMTIEDEALDDEAALASEINVGVYCFKSPWLWRALDEIKRSSNGEAYLTRLVALASAQGHEVGAVTLKDPGEGLGVNDGIQLARAREVVQRRVNEKWLLRGVNVMEPTFIDVTVELEPDTTIYPNTFLCGKTVIGQGCQIGPGSIIVDSVIADGCRVVQSVVEEAVLEADVEIGPYSHIRPESHIESDVHIGNFAEVKKSRLGKGTRMGHFSYVGDAWVGPDVNIGAGAVTCNYDGVDKHQTIIEEGAFIGSDSMLVAPVRVGARASTGAGSVVNRDVPAGAKVVGVPARIVADGSQKGRE